MMCINTYSLVKRVCIEHASYMHAARWSHWDSTATQVVRQLSPCYWRTSDNLELVLAPPDASGFTFQVWTPDVHTSRPPVAMIINSSELPAAGFKLKEVLPPALEATARGGLRTRATGLRSLEGMGPKKVCLSVDDDTEFRSRCEWIIPFLTPKYSIFPINLKRKIEGWCRHPRMMSWKLCLDHCWMPLTVGLAFCSKNSEMKNDRSFVPKVRIAPQFAGETTTIQLE